MSKTTFKSLRFAARGLRAGRLLLVRPEDLRLPRKGSRLVVGALVLGDQFVERALLQFRGAPPPRSRGGLPSQPSPRMSFNMAR